MLTLQSVLPNLVAESTRKQGQYAGDRPSEHVEILVRVAAQEPSLVKQGTLKVHVVFTSSFCKEEAIYTLFLHKQAIVYVEDTGNVLVCTSAQEAMLMLEEFYFG